MKLNKKSIIAATLAVAMSVSALTACGGGNSGDTATNPPAATVAATENGGGGASVENTPAPTEVKLEEAYTLDPAVVTGEVTVMMWSGDDSFLQDVGHKEYAPEELMGQNGAAAYATAHEFNKFYPNVKINIYAMSGDPNKDGIPWGQHRQNFAAEYGVQPDMYAAQDVPGDIERGLVADLSLYKDDPVYKMFNPSIMKMMEYDGRQFALPQYIIPWGIFVNKSLANANNIDIPEPNWTIDEFTAFTAHSSAGEWYGAMDPSTEILRTGTKDYAYQLLNRGPNDPYVNFNSDATREIIKYVPIWADNAVWPQNDLGLIPEEFMVANDWWSFNFFKNGRLLTLSGDPWMMGDAAHTNPEHWGRAQFEDWDIYPRPSTPWVGNHVGVVLDPFCIRNFAMDDSDPALSDAEKAKLDVAWEFAKFWCGDTRSWQARADQMFNDGGNLKTAMNDSFPMVTGPEFDKQMAIWYGTDTHSRFADKDKMPGFQYMMQLWEDGAFWDVSDKVAPRYYEFEGAQREVVYEWDNFYNPDIVGARRTDANWVDQMYSHLADWNTQFNQRFAEGYVNIYNALDKYYAK